MENFKFVFLTLAQVLFASAAVSNKTEAFSIFDLEASTAKKYSSPQLYVFGGSNHNTYLTAASQYNSSTGKWDSINDMAIGKDSFCGAAVGTKIYLFGGHNGGVLKTAEIYDCESGTYSEYRALSSSSPRWGCGAAVLDGFIYVAGGWDGSKRLANVVRYNIQTSRRENISPMHSVRDGHQLLELNGRLYAIAGETNSVEVFDQSTGRWSEVASTQYAHFDFGAAVHEGKIYIRSHLGFEVYSPEADQWKTLTQLDNLEGCSLVSMNGKLWSLGGGNRKDNIGTKSVFVYNLATNQWNKYLDIDVARMFHSSFVVNH